MHHSLPNKNHMQTILQEGIEYSINEKENTASVINCISYKSSVIIQRTIKQESKEYIVTSISKGAFEKSEVKTVEFEANSELRTIEQNAFCNSKLESITIPSHVTQISHYTFFACYELVRIDFEPNSELRKIEKCAFDQSTLQSISIPASVIELEEGWCSGTENLNHIDVEFGNKRYLCIDGKYIIGKSDIESEDYDMLIMWRRNNLSANIPKSIKIIGPYAFDYSKLEAIFIPSHITKICKCAFRCSFLERVQFEQNSQLTAIEEEVFFRSYLERITIPSHITQICRSAFVECHNLVRVEFEQNSELQTIDERAFSGSYIESISLPAHVTKIHDTAFDFCSNINIIELNEDLNKSPIRYSLCKHTIIMVPARKMHI